MFVRNGQLMIAVIGSILAATIAACARTWTNALDRTVEADFVRMDGINVIFLRYGRFPVLAGFTHGRGSALPRGLLVRFTSLVRPSPSYRGRLSPNPYPPRPADQSCELHSFLTNSSPEPPQAPTNSCRPAPANPCGFAGT